MDEAKLNFYLRMSHPDADARAVCRELGLEPSPVWRAGDPRITPAGTRLPGVQKVSYFSASLPLARDAEGELEPHQQIHAANLRFKKHARLLRELTASGGDFNYWLSWTSPVNVGELFHLALLRETVRLHIGLVVDFYPARR